jgi:hypothetical protein
MWAEVCFGRCHQFFTVSRALLSSPGDLKDPHMRHTCSRGDLAKACPLGMSLADRSTPGRVGLSATRCRLLHGFQGIGHVVRFSC